MTTIELTNKHRQLVLHALTRLGVWKPELQTPINDLCVLLGAPIEGTEAGDSGELLHAVQEKMKLLPDDEIFVSAKLFVALAKLQRHYAMLLNMHDGGGRQPVELPRHLAKLVEAR